MTNPFSNIAGAGGDGVGALQIQTRTSDSNPAVFVSEAARDTYYATVDGLTDLAVLDSGSGRNLAVGIGPVDGDNLGFSRSAAQRGQVTRFSAIKSPGFLRHSELAALVRQHDEDKWNFGYARLIEGSTSKEVVLQTILATPVRTGSGAPSTAPDFIGQHYIDTAAKNIYLSIGTSDSGDFELLN